jgi:hypothetical protein
LGNDEEPFSHRKISSSSRIKQEIYTILFNDENVMGIAMLLVCFESVKESSPPDRKRHRKR